MFWSNGIVDLHTRTLGEIPLPDASVHCAITSPPYWGLRNYALDDGIGLESTLAEHLENIVLMARGGAACAAR